MLYRTHQTLVIGILVSVKLAVAAVAVDRQQRFFLVSVAHDRGTLHTVGVGELTRSRARVV